jgi:hypothetical protein
LDLAFMMIQLMLPGAWTTSYSNFFPTSRKKKGYTVFSSKVLLQLIRHCEVFGERVISRGLWLPCSSDLTHCDFYLWWSLKDKEYKTNPDMLEEPRNNIHHEISAISWEVVQRVNTNMFHRYSECIWSGGQHFKHLL